MSMAQRKAIYLNNAWLARQELQYYNPATDSFEAWAGATPTVSFATDKLGTAMITPLIDLPMTAATSKPGLYYRVLSATQLNALVGYVGQTVYQVTTAGAAGELKVVVPLLVTQPRYVNG